MKAGGRPAARARPSPRRRGTGWRLLGRLGLIVALTLLTPLVQAEDEPTCIEPYTCADTMPCELVDPDQCAMVREYVEETTGELPP